MWVPERWMSQSRPIGMLSRFGYLKHSQRTWRAWLTGSLHAESQRWAWSQLGGTGSPSSKCSKNMVGPHFGSMLEDDGVRACLVNARHMKNVPGRRTDWHECQWLQYLHTAGLLRPAFRPDQDVCGVRTLLRHRNELVRMAVQHVQHMQKALTQMNVHIHHVISDITRLTRLAIVDAILSGERDVAQLAGLRQPRIRADD